MVFRSCRLVVAELIKNIIKEPFILLEKKILLFGSRGQLGKELQLNLPALGSILAVARDRVDLTRPDQIRDVINDFRPDVIVNAAAYTAVDDAEREPEIARRVNVQAPAIIAEESEKIGAVLIHYSTDYIFDGQKKLAYSEDDQPHPLSVYGYTKWQGEEHIRKMCQKHLILRTSWVYGPRGENFLTKMINLMGSRKNLRVISDQMGVPTSVGLLANTTGCLIESLYSNNHVDSSWGTYHVVASGQTSWYEYAMFILQELQQYDAVSYQVHIDPILTKDYEQLAKRPIYSVLGTQKLQSLLDIHFPPWESGVREAIKDIMDQSSNVKKINEGSLSNGE